MPACIFTVNLSTVLHLSSFIETQRIPDIWLQNKLLQRFRLDNTWNLWNYVQNKVNIKVRQNTF